MKRMLMVAAAALALSGCGDGGGGESNGQAGGGGGTANAAGGGSENAEKASAGGEAATAWLVGRWGQVREDGSVDCAETFDFSQNGDVHNGGRVDGRYELRGGRLTWTEHASSDPPAVVERRGEGRFATLYPDGTVQHTWGRC